MDLSCTLLWSQAYETHFVIGRSSNEFKWINFDVGHQESSASNDHQDELPYQKSPSEWIPFSLEQDGDNIIGDNLKNIFLNENLIRVVILLGKVKNTLYSSAYIHRQTPLANH